MCELYVFTRKENFLWESSFTFLSAAVVSRSFGIISCYRFLFWKNSTNEFVLKLTI